MRTAVYLFAVVLAAAQATVPAWAAQYGGGGGRVVVRQGQGALQIDNWYLGKIRPARGPVFSFGGVIYLKTLDGDCPLL